MIRLVLLGYQLCAYREGKKPLSTLKQLRACAATLKRHPGRELALRALKYVREGSRSPPESLICMGLTLPQYCGGLGIAETRLNACIRTEKAATRIFYADILIPSAKLIIEFDSFEIHNNARSYSEDAQRAAILEADGYQVLSVKTNQLYHLRDYEVLMKNIAKRAGKRIQIRSTEYFDKVVELRALTHKKKEAYDPRDRLIQLYEVPNFPGVKETYKRYVEAWRKKHGIKV